MNNRRAIPWENTSSPEDTQCKCSCRSPLESPQTLITLPSTIAMNDLNINGDDGPGALSDTASTEEEIKSFIENNIKALSVLIAKGCQHINKPMEDAQHPLQTRGLRELKTEFALKMEQLKRVVEDLSANDTPNDFTKDELYSLIRGIKDEDWIHLMRILINETEIETCERHYSNRREQKYQMLQIWLHKEAVKNHRGQLTYALGLIEYEQLAATFSSRSTRSGKQLVSLQILYYSILLYSITPKQKHAMTYILFVLYSYKKNSSVLEKSHLLLLLTNISYYSKKN
ncbi:uncharacterized protein LOC130354755 isoform X2 [Hyla sarda]|nr:uncharacterized protein LOC130354755 isoform X2 [Hyla sarda]XP_056411137.1 uncharacterized protein LOC130354755 isoform X2 [Hyla sarda]XP_056411138.1 uncharacterized protein LOC130354755 isoform X2 [Hyla sarda]XP_056411139.1 uncharacterized protein LOC130354755 isoform X2 [Hyla sarda]